MSARLVLLASNGTTAMQSSISPPFEPEVALLAPEAPQVALRHHLALLGQLVSGLP